MKPLAPDDPATKSADLIAENVAQLRALFPDLVTEGPDGQALNLDVLRSLVGDRTLTDAEEKYGLNWHGKRQARQIALTPSTGTLRPCPAESVDWDTTQNLMIEGDNLEVLKLLQKSYSGRVKLIYIDPPYNTGKDFVYPDDYRDNIRNYLDLTGQTDDEGRRLSSNTEASGRFHTDWLNMMYPRLFLARQLLRSDGLIGVSIGEEELPSLRLLLNEVFGEENYRNSLLARRYDKNLNRQFMERGLATLNIGAEYIVVYAKSDDCCLNPVFREASEERQTTGYWKGFWNAADRPTMRYPLLGVTPQEGQWKWQRSVALEAAANYQEYQQSHADSMTLEEYWESTGRSKRFIRRNPAGTGKNLGVESWIPPSDGILRSSNWMDLLASETLADLGIPFDSPKSCRLLQELLRLGTDEEDIVLDFFAGSGTMAHAVMAESAESNAARRYILVQLPEPLDRDRKDQEAAAEFCDSLGRPRNIAELTKERLRRVGEVLRQEQGLLAGDLGFRVYRLDSSNIRTWDPRTEDLEQGLFDAIEHVKDGRTAEDILTELLLKLGLGLSVPVAERPVAGHTVHSIGNGVLMVCLSEDVTAADVEALAQGIVEWWREQNPAGDARVVFNDSAFADDVAKANLTAILEQHGIADVRSL